MNQTPTYLLSIENVELFMQKLRKFKNVKFSFKIDGFNAIWCCYNFQPSDTQQSITLETQKILC